MGCGCGKGTRVAAPAPPSYSTWVVRWPSGSITSFATEDAARAYYDGHPSKNRLELLAPS